MPGRGFKGPADCEGFLDVVGETVSRFGIEVHAYALMPNHYHLLVRSVVGNLSEAMQYLNGTYTLWLNARHSWDGPVFRGRFRNQLVDAEGHLRILLAYVHLNPVEAHLVRRLSDEAWTSHRAYIGRDEVPRWLTTRVFLELLGGAEKLHGFVLSYRQGVLTYPEDFNPETGLFGKRAIAAGGAGLAGRGGGSRRAGAVEHPRLRDPEVVLGEVLKLTGATTAEIRRCELGPRANPARRFAIWALNRSSVLSQREIGRQLSVSYDQVTRLLGRLRKHGASEPLKTWIREWLDAEAGKEQVSSAGV